MHRAMREGQRLLIFLYPAGRLGLTSPVGGPQGQVVLGSRGEIVRTSEVGIDSSAFAARLKSCPPANLTGVGVFPGYGDFAQGECGSENSVVPAGLESFLPLSPALKRWAKLERPSGAGLSENSFLSLARKSESSFLSLAPKSDSSFPSLARERVLAPALKRCSTQNLAFSANCNAHFQNGLNAALNRCSTQDPTLLAECTASTPPVITLRQLARAIRSVRRDASAASARSKE
jgi:hypothetical protein